MRIEEIAVEGFERVAYAEDPRAGYCAVIAVHSTALGPAVGGTRLWRYGSRDEALNDALRLARGMTYKNAVAGLDAGGGKAVILAPEHVADRRALFRAHGRFVAAFGGSFTTGEDVGTGPEDMAWIAEETPYVGGLAHRLGDPSPHTARGVFRAMQAAVLHRRGSAELAGVRVAVQGCGNVGAHLARLLGGAGASLVVADVDGGRAARLASGFGAEVVEPDGIFDEPALVFAPCALGGVLNDGTIPLLAAPIVCGGANNQLLEPRHGEMLAERGVLYVPDYVANAGGVIAGVGDLRGEDPAVSAARVDAIHDTVLAVLRMAEERGTTPERAADLLAKERLTAKGAP
ncbi:MAG TPA: Glu/Leu/Phe/Val dehydrogenase dimerization domain-containing protein [Longimicrobiaceae bacterium]|nr:Glu/Leu/Phe/Val dehydrogenase dimerization domain-containing protein [Longimicrobiaceae bacterium]